MAREEKHALSHTAIYLVARGVPGVLSFLGIRLFTEWMLPEEYYKYNIIVSTAMLLNALIFQWIRLSLVRYVHAYDDSAERSRDFKSTLKSVTALIVVALGLVALLLRLVPLPAFMGDFATSRQLIMPIWVILAVQAFFELFCENARALLRPWQFMWMQVSRALGNVALGLLIIIVGGRFYPAITNAKFVGPLTGITVGMIIGLVLAYLKDWQNIPWKIDRDILRRVAQYGVPISITVALAAVIATCDRYLLVIRLGVKVGEPAAGIYAAGVDLTSQTLYLVMMVVNLAVFPLAMRAFETQGKEAAQRQMKSNASLLMAVGIPSVIGMAVLAPGIANNFLGKEFRTTAASIIPLVALGTFLSAFKAFHFDAAFQFAHRTVYQIWIVLFVAIVNIALNWVAIPLWGINGSAGASVLAYLISIVLTISIGRRHFVLPFPKIDCAMILLAAATMGGVLFPYRHSVDKLHFFPLIMIGGMIYCGMLFAMNFKNARPFIMRKLRRASTSPAEQHPVVNSIAQKNQVLEPAVKTAHS